MTGSKARRAIRPAGAIVRDDTLSLDLIALAANLNVHRLLFLQRLLCSRRAA